MAARWCVRQRTLVLPQAQQRHPPLRGAHQEASPMIEVVTGILIRTDGRVLLQRRAIDAAPEWSGAWNTPGGKVDIGETDEEALVREFKEEVCLDIAVGDYFAQVEFKVPILYAVTYYYVRGT